MIDRLETKRLLLRPWQPADAAELYKYAKNDKIGPIAGWPVHTSIENSSEIIETVLSKKGTYAVVLKETDLPVGSIGLMVGKDSNLEIPETEAEVGYWIGVPYWGQGLIPEAVQEKCGLIYHHTNENIHWVLMDDIRTEHITCITREQWRTNHEKYTKS